MIMATDQLSAAMRPLSEASSMPAGFYTDPEVFRAEREYILLASWIFLAATISCRGPVITGRSTRLAGRFVGAW